MCNFGVIAAWERGWLGEGNWHHCRLGYGERRWSQGFVGLNFGVCRLDVGASAGFTFSHMPATAGYQTGITRRSYFETRYEISINNLEDPY